MEEDNNNNNIESKEKDKEKDKENGPSKETLDKVQQMKKRVEDTIHGRVDNVKERRLRHLRLEHKMKELNMNDDEKQKFRDDYFSKERQHLRQQRQKLGVKDFALVKVIGKGAFGEVRIVREKQSQQVYAMKSMRKKDMVAKNQVTHVQAERDLMAAADNPWLVKLHYSFQDDTYLYLVMEYCGGGDLMTILMREDILDEEKTKFYISELGCAIHAVHELDFVHRDLKPDNILIANDGHVKLSDFGLAKSFNTSNDQVISKYQKNAHTLKEEDLSEVPLDQEARDKYRRDRKLMYSTVGTPDYIAPEVFSQKGYDKMVDWWSMGVIMFECLIGYPPFYADDPLQTCRKIVHYRKYFKIPHDAKLSREAIDLIHNLVCSNRRRYDFEQIKKHGFFKEISWDNLSSIKAPYIPKMKSDVDSANFEEVEAIEQTIDKEMNFSKPTDKNHFWGYTFNRGINLQSPEIENMLKDMEKTGTTQNNNDTTKNNKIKKQTNNSNVTKNKNQPNSNNVIKSKSKNNVDNNNDNRNDDENSNDNEDVSADNEIEK